MPVFSRWSLPAAALLLLAGLNAAAAQMADPSSTGGGLAVAPVQLALTSASRSVSTVVSNYGATPVTVQVRLYSWTMHGEDEVYGPATDAGFSPPLFRLEPHATQSVRIVAKVPPGPIERSYRLIVDQLPLAAGAGQLQLPVRMVLPVFVEPAAVVSRTPALEWSAHQDAQTKRISIGVSNRGAVHVRLVDLVAQDGIRSTVVAPGLAGYALAGQERQWSYKADNAPATLTITARDGAKTVRVTVPVTRR